MKNSLSNLATLSLLSCCGSALAAATFTGGPTLSAPQRPSGVVVADLNGDGLNDLAVTTDTPDKVSIFFNSATGLATVPVNVLTGSGSSPDSIQAADLDGDGDQDLIVALKNIGQVRAYINTAGVFTAGASAAAGSEPRGMAKGNLDGVGALDFAIADNAGTTVTTLRYIAGAWVTASFTVGDEPKGVVIADFNGDGLGDLAVTNHRDRNISVMRNLGGGAMGGRTDHLVGNPYRPEGIAALDIDKDGDMDLAVVASDDTVVNQVALFRNTGGTFGTAQFRPTGGIDASEIVAADLDGDGDTDLAVTHTTSNTVAVLDNVAGVLGAPAAMSTGAFPGGLAIGNVVGSNALDIIVSNRDSNTVQVFVNDATNQCPSDFNGDGFVNGDDFDAYVLEFVNGALAADFNGDGFTTGDDYDAFATAFQAGC